MVLRQSAEENIECKREEVTVGRRKLYDKELQNCYSSPYIIMFIRYRKMQWPGNAAYAEEVRKAYKKLTWKNHLEGSAIY
jgi:hypothetical protein